MATIKSKVSSAVRDYYLSLGFQRKQKLWFEHDVAADTVGGILVWRLC